jgi:hypothetical protein
MTNQFEFLTDTTKYTSGQATKVFVSKPYFPGEAIPSETLTLSAAVDVNDATITVTTGCTEKLYEGTRLNFGTESSPKIFYVSAETAAAATTIPIEPAEVAATSGATCKLEAFIPVFSAKTANADNQTQSFNDQNFSTLEVAMSVSGIQGQGSVAGAYIFGDPGHKVIQTALKAAKLCKIEILDAYGRGGDYAQTYFSVNKARSNNQFNQVTYNLMVTGSWTEMAVNP